MTPSADYLAKLTEAAPAGHVSRWEVQIKAAEQKHISSPDAMDVMAADVPKRE